jgi:hypothetical protein
MHCLRVKWRNKGVVNKNIFKNYIFENTIEIEHIRSHCFPEVTYPPTYIQRRKLRPRANKTRLHCL